MALSFLTMVLLSAPTDQLSLAQIYSILNDDFSFLMNEKVREGILLRMLDVEGVVLGQEGGVLQQPGARLRHLHLLDDTLRRRLRSD